VTDPAPRAGAEAARLLVAAQQWLRGSAPHLAPVDAAGEPCSCPLCRAVAAVRDADPESVARWVDGAVAAVERVAADAAAATAGAASGGPAGDARAEAETDDGHDDGPQPEDGSAGTPRSGRTPRVRRIPLDGTPPDGGAEG
jgi:hypothetical protein